ncbi:hypothetical protein Y023_4199 [Burkholderia pseudomallei A79D]|nr:hypothetical protein Y023_4199 [Burkholderia pseudomallei A79D]
MNSCRTAKVVYRMRASAGRAQRGGSPLGRRRGAVARWRGRDESVTCRARDRRPGHPTLHRVAVAQRHSAALVAHVRAPHGLRRPRTRPDSSE